MILISHSVQANIFYRFRYLLNSFAKRVILDSEKEQELRRAALMERSIFSKRKTPPEDRVRATSTGKEILVSNLQRLSNGNYKFLNIADEAMN